MIKIFSLIMFIVISSFIGCSKFKYAGDATEKMITTDTAQCCVNPHDGGDQINK